LSIGVKSSFSLRPHSIYAIRPRECLREHQTNFGASTLTELINIVGIFYYYNFGYKVKGTNVYSVITL
jgi:hypothetical protein